MGRGPTEVGQVAPMSDGKPGAMPAGRPDANGHPDLLDARSRVDVRQWHEPAGRTAAPEVDVGRPPRTYKMRGEDNRAGFDDPDNNFRRGRPLGGIGGGPSAGRMPHRAGRVARHAEAFAESRKVTRPALARLLAEWDKVETAEGHAGRHAAIYRFAAGFPGLGPQLAAELESSEAAMEWAERAIFCLQRER